jgi:hypothetical protein
MTAEKVCPTKNSRHGYRNQKRPIVVEKIGKFSQWDHQENREKFIVQKKLWTSKEAVNSL